MKIGLKGITDAVTFNHANSFGIESFSFDLRPRSFNFIQEYMIVEILRLNPTSSRCSLLFADEKDFMVQELCTRVEEQTGLNCLPEFAGVESISDLEKLKRPYLWHYHTQGKIKDIYQADYLDSIILNQDILKTYDDAGELIGFFNLLNEKEGLKVEILVDWDSPIPMSLLEMFPIECLSFEVNNKVEISYRNIDFDMMKLHLKEVTSMISQLDAR
jgi:hypothetical protein